MFVNMANQNSRWISITLRQIEICWFLGGNLSKKLCWKICETFFGRNGVFVKSVPGAECDLKSGNLMESKVRILKMKDVVVQSPLCQPGVPDFFRYKLPKLAKKIRNDHQMYQNFDKTIHMAIIWPSKIYLNRYFWYWYMPFGNPGATCLHW
jgi:hypothetical protein